MLSALRHHMYFNRSIYSRLSPLMPSPQSVKRCLRYLARKTGYELVGEGESWNDMRGYRLFSRKLPKAINNESKDPYRTPLSVPITSVTSRVGFSYAEDGWHPFVQTLKEYIANPELRYEDSSLARLYHQYRPQNMQEVLLDHIETPQMPFCDWLPKYELITWLWVLNKRNNVLHQDSLTSKPNAGGWIFFGPHTQEYGRKEFQRLIGVYESIKHQGYRQELADMDSVNGYFLKKGTDIRFVLLQGNHRVSALKALGYSDVSVLIRKAHPAVIDHAKLHKWTKGSGGIYPLPLVENIFESLFSMSGLQKAQRYGLVK